MQVSITPDKPMGQKKKLAQAMCQHPACTVKPSYGYEGSKKLLVSCVTHKEKGMIYLASKRCGYSSCNKQAGFGLPGNVRDTHILRLAPY
jgi:EsV-1-7 cysteine-rich motif